MAFLQRVLPLGAFLAVSIYLLLSFHKTPATIGGPSSRLLIDPIPPIGLGTWLSEKRKVAHAVNHALASGYRHIDAAAAYNNEPQTGAGIKASGLNRTSLWITSKLWNTAHRPENVRPALEKTINDLGVGYLDLYLMHWPVAFEPPSPSPTSKGPGPVLDKSVSITDTWRAMEDTVRANLTRHIGISNFSPHDVRAILSMCTICPAAHEFETHPYLQQTRFVQWHAQLGLPVIAYSPLANTNPTYDSPVPGILKDPFFVDLAERKNASVAQVVLQWGMARGTIVIPKSVHDGYIKENLGAVDVELTAGDMVAIEGVDRRVRFNDPSRGWGVRLFQGLDGAGGSQDAGVEEL